MATGCELAKLRFQPGGSRVLSKPGTAQRHGIWSRLIHLGQHPRSTCRIVRFFDEAMDNKFGFSSFAETWNGRLAMMGFIIGLGTELLTGQGILSQIGMG